MFALYVQRIRCFALVTGILAGVFTARIADAAQRYKIIALEPLPGGMDSRPTAINDLGVVVGYSTLDRSGNIGQARPVMWDSSGKPIELWPYEGPSTPGAVPRGINNAGQIVGQYHVGSGTPLPSLDLKAGRAFIWDAVNGRRDLGSLGGSRVEAVAINDRGEVAGSSYLAHHLGIEGYEAFIWDETNGMRGLGTLGGRVSHAADINNHGQIVGTSWLANDREQPFLWDPITGMHNLGSISGEATRALAMNDSGEVVGLDSGVGRVVWSAAGSPSPIINPPDWYPGLSRDFDNRGRIVGGARTLSFGTTNPDL